MSGVRYVRQNEASEEILLTWKIKAIIFMFLCQALYYYVSYSEECPPMFSAKISVKNKSHEANERKGTFIDFLICVRR